MENGRRMIKLKKEIDFRLTNNFNRLFYESQRTQILIK